MLAAVLFLIAPWLRPSSRPAPPVPPLAAINVTVAGASEVRPGWNDGRVEPAADCLLPGGLCRVEAPCAYQHCAPQPAINLASLTGPVAGGRSWP